MSRLDRALAFLVVSLSVVVIAASAPAGEPAVQDAGGRTIKTFGPLGQPNPHHPGAPFAKPGATLDPKSPLDPPAGSGAAPCEAPGERGGTVWRESRDGSVTVDPCGERHLAGGGGGGRLPESRSLPHGPLGPARVTIDSMTTGWNSYGYTVESSIQLLGPAHRYFLSDGTSWTSGAGSFRVGTARFDRVEVSGTTVRYYFWPPDLGTVYEQTDYDSGDHSAQGILGSVMPLLLEATLGSRFAVMRGQATIINNDATWYGEPRFNYYSAPVGTMVPFEIVYDLSTAGGWTEDVFTRPMSYSSSGRVSFVTGVTRPALTELSISGAPQVTGQSTYQYRAVARYENGALQEVSDQATWSVEPATLATIEGGLLTTLPIHTPQENLTVRATYTEESVTRQAEKVVVYRAVLPDPGVSDWPMYQANNRHTGYLPLSLDPADFTPLWQAAIGEGRPLNPATAADGRVFCSKIIYFDYVPSLFTLDAEDGSILWSKTFEGNIYPGAGVFSVNPPSYSYGNVYVQTGDHSQDTWLHAFDAATGEPVFRSAHGAQWERYFAPTIYDGKVYVNGGSYGGAYGFDALTGDQLWFRDLPQYDEWTPAVHGENVYAYVGAYDPGLYVMNRHTGGLEFMIRDPSFEWDGWSMRLAPVLGTHSDVIAIHDERLINFDIATRTIRWQIPHGFSGQPSVAHDAIYVIDHGRLLKFDEVTGAHRWTWTPPPGPGLTGALIVTDTHVFASNGSTVYAVNLATQQSDWSYPRGGHLSLGNGSLYVAGADGILAAIQVVPPNQPPDCSAAAATVQELWPPNHGLTPVGVTGVTDPEGGPVTITVTGITSDEPVDSNGDGNTCPDGTIDGAGTARVRAERQGGGDGRVYAISFTATDERGASCPGRVTVCVPHDHHSECVDGGQAHDALASCGSPGPGMVEIPDDVELRVAGMDGRRFHLDFAVPTRGLVDLTVFDVSGRRVATVERGTRAAGRHQVSWNGAGQPAGIYFVRLRAGGRDTTRPIRVRR